VNRCNLDLNPISCKSSRAARLSFVFPLMSKIVPSILSMTFFFYVHASRLCRNKFSFHYGSLKKILFFFHTLSSELAAPVFHFFRFFLPMFSSLNAIPSNCWRISSLHGTFGAHSNSPVPSNVHLFSRHRYSVGKYLLCPI
jgi:hypothetical protein